MKLLMFEFWPAVIFFVIIVFTLGGYAFMIKFMNERIRTLFYRDEKQDVKINCVETTQAVIKERMDNICDLAKENKEMLTTILLKLQSS